MLWRRRKQSDFEQEIQAHLDLEIEQLQSDGMSRKEASAAAARAFGNIASTRERFYESSRWLWLEHLRRDVAYALRVLSRSPGFTLVAVLSLALGIGVNALVFSVVNALVLRPLPIERPARVMFVQGGRGEQPTHSFPNYRDFRDRNQSFSGLVGFRTTVMEMETNDRAERIWGYLATGNYFDVLGIRPALGRFFHAADDMNPGASPYVVLSYSYWHGRFDADPEIAGKMIRINGRPFTVLGVAPDQFHGTEILFWPEVWVPMMMQAQIEVGNAWLENRNVFDTAILGRLKPGVSAARATDDLNSIASDLAHQYPLINDGLQIRLTRPGLIGDSLGRPARAFAWGLLVLAGLVLLAACTNLASLLTARASDRQREIAIRLSIGATRWRIVRQVLTETLVLALMGGAAGYGLAAMLSRVLSHWHGPLDLPVQLALQPDWRVFIFAFAVSLLAGVLFGAAPASQACRTDAQAVLKGEQMSWRKGRIATRDVLVALQIAICFVLVSACLLSLRGLQQSLRLHLGIEPDGISVVSFDVGLAGYTEEQGRNLQRRTFEAVEQLPGVTAAAYSNSVPLSIDQSSSESYSEDLANPTPREAKSAFVYQISPQYFQTLGIGLLAGRDFDWHDDRNSPLVAVVNRAFAKQVLHSDVALRKRFRFGAYGPLVQVVGVVEDGKYQSLTEAERPAVFEPILQSYNTTTTLLVKTSMPEAAMADQMRRAVTEVDPHLALYGTGSLRQLLRLAFVPARAAAIALSGFGLLAIMLAATGIHGLVSYGVARRVKEIGIRMAIGARPAQVVRLVLGRTLMLIAAGSLLGLGLAWAAGAVLTSIVYETSPHDPLLLAMVMVAIGLLGVFSSWAPMQRALRIEPTVALRHE